MNIFYVGRHHTRFLGLLVGVFLCGSVVAQFPNPDATLLFSRSPIGGTARTAGAGGAFSSVGADIGSIDLNPAGLGLFNTTDICITPGIKIAADRSNYDGTNTNANHVGFEFAQAGAVITKKINRSSTQTSGSYALKSISFGISFQADNFFGRDQSFGTLNNTNSLVDNFAYVSSIKTKKAPHFCEAGSCGRRFTCRCPLDSKSAGYRQRCRPLSTTPSTCPSRLA